jgi:outer membrane protein OmpA-like peptidoglycan-associated protein
MENLMINNAVVGEEDLRQLANRRAQAAKDYLVETGKVPADRVFLTGARVGGEAPRDGKGTRADFSLK